MKFLIQFLLLLFFLSLAKSNLISEKNRKLTFAKYKILKEKPSNANATKLIFKDLSRYCNEEMNIMCKRHYVCGRPNQHKRGHSICCLSAAKSCDDDSECCFGSHCVGRCLPHTLATGKDCVADEECFNDFRCCGGICCNKNNCMKQQNGNILQETCASPVLAG